MLALRGRGRFTDTDVADVAQLAIAGLIDTGRRGVMRTARLALIWITPALASRLDDSE